MNDNLTVGELINRLQYLVSSDPLVQGTTPTNINDIKIQPSLFRLVILEGDESPIVKELRSRIASLERDLHD